jgi:hypothetical protein
MAENYTSEERELIAAGGRLCRFAESLRKGGPPDGDGPDADAEIAALLHETFPLTAPSKGGDLPRSVGVATAVAKPVKPLRPRTPAYAFVSALAFFVICGVLLHVAWPGFIPGLVNLTPTSSGEKEEEKDLDSTLRWRIHDIQVALERYAIQSDGLYPEHPSILLGGYMDSYPENPYTGEMMRPVQFGSEDYEGNFCYIPVIEGGQVTGFTLFGFGAEGEPGRDYGYVDTDGIFVSEPDGRPDHAIIDLCDSFPPANWNQGDARIKSAMLKIQEKLELYARHHGGIYPDDFAWIDGSYLKTLPANPYTLSHMRNVPFGSAEREGNFTYVPRYEDGRVRGYVLYGYGRRWVPGEDYGSAENPLGPPDGEPDHIIVRLTESPDNQPTPKEGDIQRYFHLENLDLITLQMNLVHELAGACVASDLGNYTDGGEINRSGLIPFTLLNLQTGDPLSEGLSRGTIHPGEYQVLYQPGEDQNGTGVEVYYNQRESTVKASVGITNTGSSGEKMKLRMALDCTDEKGNEINLFNSGGIRRREESTLRLLRLRVDYGEEAARSLFVTKKWLPFLLGELQRVGQLDKLLDPEEARAALGVFGIRLGNDASPYPVDFHFGQESPDDVEGNSSLVGRLQVWFWSPDVNSLNCRLLYFRSVGEGKPVFSSESSWSVDRPSREYMELNQFENTPESR